MSGLRGLDHPGHQHRHFSRTTTALRNFDSVRKTVEPIEQEAGRLVRIDEWKLAIAVRFSPSAENACATLLVFDQSAGRGCDRRPQWFAASDRICGEAGGDRLPLGRRDSLPVPCEPSSGSDRLRPAVFSCANPTCSSNVRILRSGLVSPLSWKSLQALRANSIAFRWLGDFTMLGAGSLRFDMYNFVKAWFRCA